MKNPTQRLGWNYDEHPFKRQKMFPWLGVQQVARAGLKVLFAERVAAFTDRREMQAALAPREHRFDYDYSGRNEVWFDYASDVGDGFDPTYAVALQMTRSMDAPNGDGTLSRPTFVVLGGDEVYPVASRSEYWQRFHAPYRAALPETTEDQCIDLFAVPGNHDWYDGLTNFIRLFCQERRLGGWQTRQCRSYFAVKLPHNWYLWGVDVQLESYIDYPQLRHFEAVAKLMVDEAKPERPKLILCTAQPDWVHCGDPESRERATIHSDPYAYQRLAFFEDRVIRRRGIALELVLAGDLHHYARYTSQPSGDGSPRHRITCGNGGAYLSSTHALPSVLTVPMSAEKNPLVQSYALERTYPGCETSQTVANGVFWSLLTTWSFGALVSAFYLVTSLAAVLASGDVFLLITVIGLCGLLITVPLFVYATSDRQPTKVDKGWGILHGVAHTVAALGLGALFNVLNPSWPRRTWLLVPEMVVAGYVVGTLIFASYVWLSARLRGRHHNEVFAAQSGIRYKGFLRCRLGATGLHIYPIGIPNPPTHWEESSTGVPRYKPKTPIVTEAMDSRIDIP